MLQSRLCLLLVAFLIVWSDWGQCQGPFDPKRDAMHDLRLAKQQAHREQKHILLDFGANWCGPCVSFDRVLDSDVEVNSLLHHGFVLVHVPVETERDTASTRAVRRLYPKFTLVPHLLVLSANGSLMAEQKISSLLNLDALSKDPEHVQWDRLRIASFLKQCGAPEACKKGL